VHHRSLPQPPPPTPGPQQVLTAVVARFNTASATDPLKVIAYDLLGGERSIIEIP